MNIWQTLLSIFGGSALLLGSVAYLIKSIINHYLTKDIDKYKFSVKHESDIEIEKFKNSLNISLIEYKIRYSKLHDKRVEVIINIYSFLKEALDKTRSFVEQFEYVGEPSKEEKGKLANQAIFNFYDIFNKNRIWLDKKLCKQIDSLYCEFSKPASSFALFYELAKNDKGLVDQRNAKWDDAYDKFINEVPKALDIIEEEFRTLLGVLEFK